MDTEPKTRKESKKTAKEKSQSCYSTKHIRQLEAILEKKSKSSK